MAVMGILHNKVLVAAFFGWLSAQTLKTIIELVLNKKVVWSRMMRGDGGMPSCHSATVTALATATALTCGFDSPIFALASIFAFVVMHDAMGVRLETGKQSQVLNNIMDYIKAISDGTISWDQSLKELVGHTPNQVFVGMSLGLVVGILVSFFWVL